MAKRWKPYVERLFDSLKVTDSCWIWTGHKNDSGYGITYDGSKGRQVRAHRAMYELLKGPIPEGLDLDHLCRVRDCVNPDHLEPVTRGENVRRGVSAQAAKARSAAQTHCKRGHEYTPENTRMQTLTTGSQARVCRARHAYRARARKQR